MTIKEVKTVLVYFGKGGSGGVSASLRLKPSLLDELGITPDKREVDVIYTEDSIIIRRA